MLINNYEFEVIEKGNGTPVVFVHGSVSDYRTWEKQMEVFSTKHKAITYSRRFHWPNQKIKPNQDYSLDQHVSDLEEIIKKIGSPVRLIGHSYGAVVGLMLALLSPQLVKSLIISEPPIIGLYISNIPKPKELLKLLFTKPKTALTLIKFGASGMDPAKKAVKNNDIAKAIEIFGKASLGSETYQALSEERRSRVLENFIKAEFLGSGFPRIDAKEISSIKIPTLLLTGTDSPNFFHVLMDSLEKLLPNHERQQIPNASHISHEDNSEAFNNLVLSFIKKQDV